MINKEVIIKMKKSKQKALEKKGWKIGDTQEFLNLSNEEMEYIESKIALANKLRAYREKKGLSQVHLANIIKSSQSRVAKMESGDPTVSIDLLVKTLYALGISRKQIFNLHSLGQ